MSRFIAAVIGIAALCAVLPAHAHEYTVGSLKIGHPWARATPKGATVGAGYLTVTNTGSAPDRLLGGSIEVADRTEIHVMRMENGVMTMRPLAGGIEIKPGETVTLEPGGYHLMFIGLKAPLKQDSRVKGTLVFEKAGTVEVEFAVAGLGAMHGSDDHVMPAMPMQH
ncbi:MAG: copper chaperone PCu(A)C [Pseudolabrys sp.]|nr:copper chaperone PCu(A)C [Pseudolabrys sp.]